MSHAIYILVSNWIHLAKTGSTARMRARARRALLATFLSPGSLPPDRRLYDHYYGENGAR